MVRLFDRDDPAGRRTCHPGRFQDPLGAYAFVAYLLFVDFSAHNFWDMQGAARGANMAHFYKNLGIMGGFLLLALQGAGRYSADAQMSRSWLSRQMSRIGLSRG